MGSNRSDGSRTRTRSLLSRVRRLRRRLQRRESQCSHLATIVSSCYRSGEPPDAEDASFAARVSESIR